MAVRADYYQLLGVARDADGRTIKNAFRRLARRYHPDTSAEPDAEERFKEIAEAYGVLSDPARRARYDAGDLAGLAGATPEDLWGGIDFADIFGAGAPGFGGGLFEQLFGHPASAGPPRGADIEVPLTIPLREVLTGGRQAITITRPGPCPPCAGRGARPGTAPRTCPDCAGTGQRATSSQRGTLMVRQVTGCQTCLGRGSIIDQPCPGCHGTGQTTVQDTVTVRITPGIAEGAALRLARRGMPSAAAGGQPGDAYVVIRTQADPAFTRRGADLWRDLHIQVPDAVLGTTATVPALDGPARVVIPPGVQSGTILRLSGTGLPRYRGHGRGDLNVSITVDIPARLGPRQRQLYEQLRGLETSARSEPAASAAAAGASPGPVRRRRHRLRRHSQDRPPA